MNKRARRDFDLAGSLVRNVVYVSFVFFMYTSIRRGLHVYIYIHVYVYVHIHVYVTYTYIFIYILLLYLYIYTCICIRTYTCICYIYIFIYIYIHVAGSGPRLVRLPSSGFLALGEIEALTGVPEGVLLQLANRDVDKRGHRRFTLKRVGNRSFLAATSTLWQRGQNLAHLQKLLHDGRLHQRRRRQTMQSRNG